eukprot:CCRYP_008504-RB/>CCRYP_008504-RB protein AED:0.10 eAED:0.10 QI:257/1/1/1/0/0/3/43/147
MDQRGSPHPYASCSACANTLGPAISVPTVKSKEDTSTKELDITSLTESAIESLRTDDPFMYYSVFKPTGNHGRDPDIISITQNLRKESQLSSFVVSRRSRISVECDPLTAVLQEMMEDNCECSEREHRLIHCDCFHGDECSTCMSFS